MPLLVNELQAKLEDVGADVSHTTVKEAKETHLESKTLKGELHDLAVRRLTRARETSTERVIALMALWSKGEHTICVSELISPRHIEKFSATCNLTFFCSSICIRGRICSFIRTKNPEGCHPNNRSVDSQRRGGCVLGSI